MKIYECPECKRKYLPCDLVKTKCSENYVGSYMIGYCPECLEKKIRMIELKEYESKQEGSSC